MWAVTRVVPETRLASLLGLVLAGVVGSAGFLAVQRLCGGPGALLTLRTLGGSDEPTAVHREEVHPEGVIDG